MAINKELKELIRQIKFAYALKQGQIAEQLGVTESYLSDAINGRAPFSDNLRTKIQELFSDIDMKINPHIVFGGQHVEDGDAINGDKFVEQVTEKTQEEATEETIIKTEDDVTKTDLLDLLRAKQKSLDDLIAQQGRYLTIIESLTQKI